MQDYKEAAVQEVKKFIFHREFYIHCFMFIFFIPYLKVSFDVFE